MFEKMVNIIILPKNVNYYYNEISLTYSPNWLQLIRQTIPNVSKFVEQLEHF